jgi:hypothetical protein
MAMKSASTEACKDFALDSRLRSNASSDDEVMR